MDTEFKPCAEYNAAAVSWDLIQDLLGGTRKMRKAASKWLPREEKEPELNYQARLNRSVLYNALKNTIKKIASRPFAQPITTDQDNINVDHMGNKLTQFAQDVFKSAITYGRSHILVDFPSENGTNLRDEKSPYFCLVTAPQLIDWDTTIIDGAAKLTRIVIRLSDDKVRVIDETEWSEWEREKAVWVKTDSGTHTFGSVPIVTIQLSEGFMSAEPMFEDIAWLNLAHWQSSSDHRNILRAIRVPILVRTGFTDDELKKPVVIGPTNVVNSINAEARLKFVEHTGKAVEQGIKDLERLEDQMESLGMQPLVADVQRTAKEVQIDNDRSMSEAQVWASKLEAGLVEAYVFRGRWQNREVEPEVSVFMDFNVNAQDADMLLRAAAANKISDETFLSEWKRRGILHEDLDVKDEVEKLQQGAI